MLIRRSIMLTRRSPCCSSSNFAKCIWIIEGPTC
jgi:hypothetical protein